MPSLDKLTTEGSFMGMFIGKSGDGKTCAAASFPRPILFLDFDSRIRGILGASWIDREGLGDVEFFPPKSKKQVYVQINEILDGVMDKCNSATNRYKTIVVGSMTSLTFGLLMDAIPLTHTAESGHKKGKTVGTLPMAGPEDYGFEATGSYSFLAYLRALMSHPNGPKNIIVDAHIVDRWGKPVNERGVKDTYAESIIIGEKLSLRDKISENIQIYFDHVFRFSRQDYGDSVKHFVQFRTDLARTAYAALPDGKVDITGKDFYKTMRSYIEGTQK